MSSVIVVYGFIAFLKDLIQPTKIIKANIKAFVAAINRAKPSTAKGRYIKNAALSLTMSPAIKFDSQELMDIRL